MSALDPTPYDHRQPEGPLLYPPFSGDQPARPRDLPTVLEVSEEEKRVIDLGSNMVNLGKAFVPQEVLTKTTPFTDDDRRLIHEGWAKSAKLLERVSFDLEVDLILQQTRENWDGSGLPKGLAGEEISTPRPDHQRRRKTFVGMLSDRAYRPGKDIPEATQEMVALAGKLFDRRVVMALNHYLENKGGRDVLDLLRQDPAESLDVHLDAFFAAT